jgi:methylaspartate mutase sigma subunit
MELELPLRINGDRALDVVVTSVSSDAHMWNLVYLQLVLEELGHRVTNLGACVPDDLLLSECRALRPDLIVISTVNGHGARDGMRVITAIRACPELVATPVVIGGKLDVIGDALGTNAENLLTAGFDGVFQDAPALHQFRSYVQSLPASMAQLPVGA